MNYHRHERKIQGGKENTQAITEGMILQMMKDTVGSTRTILITLTMIGDGVDIAVVIVGQTVVRLTEIVDQGTVREEEEVAAGLIMTIIVVPIIVGVIPGHPVTPGQGQEAIQGVEAEVTPEEATPEVEAGLGQRTDTDLEQGLEVVLLLDHDHT